MKFILQAVRDDYDYEEKTVTFEFDAVHISNVLEEVELFLKANGFDFNGRLDIVEDDKETDDWNDDFENDDEEYEESLEIKFDDNMNSGTNDDDEILHIRV